MSADSELLGFNGKFLRVDVGTGSICTERRNEDYYRRYLGGRGFIIDTLLKEIPRGAEALGAANKLVFALGPITGHALIGSGRNIIGAKSPLTGGYGESDAGGFWGAQLKRSGYDAIIVEGVSEVPVYIYIDNGEVDIRDAAHLWGLDIDDTRVAIQKDLGDERVSVAAIGPAGETLVRYASITNDSRHVAGRTGMGAVMGSKRLKAVAVRGRKPPRVADREGLLELNRWMGRNYREKASVCGYGTGATIQAYEASGNLPVLNFKGGWFPGVKNITPQLLFEKQYVKSMDHCFGCPIRCKRRVGLGEPWGVDPIYGGPEYETLAAFGANCGIDNLEAIVQANNICNRFGMDTISAGVCISFAMECFERGLLTREDTNGLDLRFGNAESMLAMVRQIAMREGLGRTLGEGTKRAADLIGQGSHEFAMHVKGLELPMHDPRYKQGMGLHYSVSITGADHGTGIHDDLVSKKRGNWEAVDFSEEMPSIELSPRKARMVYQTGLWRHMYNYLGICFFVPWSYKQLRDAVECITGWPMSFWKLMKATERGIALARIFNLREGFSTADDRLPKRFGIAVADGPLEGVCVDPGKLDKAQKVYFQMLDWDESGVPTYGRLAELDLEWAWEYIPDEAL